jgi:hypothetical protein
VKPAVVRRYQSESIARGGFMLFSSSNETRSAGCDLLDERLDNTFVSERHDCVLCLLDRVR